MLFKGCDTPHGNPAWERRHEECQVQSYNGDSIMMHASIIAEYNPSAAPAKIQA
jgi:hypothetical protein